MMRWTSSVAAVTIFSVFALGMPQDADAKKRTFHKRLNNVLENTLDGAKLFKKNDRVVFKGGIGVPSRTKAFVRKLNANGRIMNTRSGLPVKIKDALLVTGNTTLEGTLDLAGYECESGQVFGYDGTEWGCQYAVTAGTGISIDNAGAVSLAGRARTIQLPIKSWMIDQATEELDTASTPDLDSDNGLPSISWGSAEDGNKIMTSFQLPSDYVAGTDVTLNLLVARTSIFGADDSATWNTEHLALGETSPRSGNTFSDNTAEVDISNPGNYANAEIVLEANNENDDGQTFAAGETVSLTLTPTSIGDEWQMMSASIEYTAK